MDQQIISPIMDIRQKEKTLKTYVLTLSARFPQYHPRAGELTNFRDQFIHGKKKHTIRGNYDRWKKQIDNINAGNAKLSVRGWIGKPYASNQYIIRELYAGEVGIQKVDVEVLLDDLAGEYANININSLLLYPNYSWQDVASNDGLSPDDFLSWFKDPVVNGAMIHFTKLRY